VAWVDRWVHQSTPPQETGLRDLHRVAWVDRWVSLLMARGLQQDRAAWVDRWVHQSTPQERELQQDRVAWVDCWVSLLTARGLQQDRVVLVDRRVHQSKPQGLDQRQMTSLLQQLQGEVQLVQAWAPLGHQPQRQLQTRRLP
jgi:hypothetical protein